MAQASNVIPFPRRNLTFRPDDFQGVSLLASYETHRPLIAVCQRVLECTPQQLQARLDLLAAESDGAADDVQRLVADFDAAAEDCQRLALLFEGAVARVVAVHNRLV